ncbi:MAG: AraC family transcriptional regulator [Ramlibacter sp.]|nr:AraC family transcriptional regulator [Ramlibacter sp.]
MVQRLTTTELEVLPEISYWSTEHIAPAKKTEFWVDALCAAYCRLDCRPKRMDSFDGAIASIPVGDFSLSRVTASEQDVANRPSFTSDAQQAFYLVSDLSSSWAVTQDGCVSQLRRGDIALIDARRPSLSEYSAGTNVVALQVPLTWVQEWLAAVDCKATRVISSEQGWGKVLSTVCAELGSNLRLASQTSPEFLSDHLGGLLAASLEPLPQGALLAAHDLPKRVQAVMYERLSEPALSAQSLADHFHVSVRTLHRCFAAQGTTFSTTLRRARLERALRLLENPRLARLSIKELASRSGFQSSSHFIREFQREWGTSPGRWRQLNTTVDAK